MTHKCCANCANVGTTVCKDCTVGNPPSLWQPEAQAPVEGDHDR